MSLLVKIVPLLKHFRRLSSPPYTVYREHANLTRTPQLEKPMAVVAPQLSQLNQLRTFDMNQLSQIGQVSKKIAS